MQTCPLHSNSIRISQAPQLDHCLLCQAQCWRQFKNASPAEVLPSYALNVNDQTPKVRVELVQIFSCPNGVLSAQTQLLLFSLLKFPLLQNRHCFLQCWTAPTPKQPAASHSASPPTATGWQGGERRGQKVEAGGRKQGFWENKRKACFLGARLLTLQPTPVI